MQEIGPGRRMNVCKEAGGGTSLRDKAVVAGRQHEEEQKMGAGGARARSGGPCGQLGFLNGTPWALNSVTSEWYF